MKILINFNKIILTNKKNLTEKENLLFKEKNKIFKKKRNSIESETKLFSDCSKKNYYIENNKIKLKNE